MKAIIIYETQVGTTKYVAEIISSRLTKLGHSVVLHSARTDGPQPNLEGCDLVLLGSPTYESGQVEPAMGKLLASFAPDLSQYKVAIFSLGDSNYEHFCGSAEVMEQWVTSHGGTLLVPTLKIDGYPSDLTQIDTWIQGLVQP